MVTVIGASGHEDFEGELIAELPSMRGGLISIIRDPNTEETFVIPSQYVDEGALEEC